MLWRAVALMIVASELILNGAKSGPLGLDLSTPESSCDAAGRRSVGQNAVDPARARLLVDTSACCDSRCLSGKGV